MQSADYATVFRDFVLTREMKQLNEVIAKKKKSFFVNFLDLYFYNQALGAKLINEPMEVLPLLEDELYRLIIEKDITGTYKDAVAKTHVRVKSLPELVPLRKIKSEHQNKLIQIEAIVVKSTAVKQKLVKAVYKHEHLDCGQEFQWPLQGDVGDIYDPPSICPLCGRSGRFRLVKKKLQFIDWQKAVVQERPEELPPGQLPRTLEVVLEDDIVDTARPGDRVRIVGVLEAKTEQMKRGSVPVLDSYLKVNSVEVLQKAFEDEELTEEEKMKIQELSKDPWIADIIVKSIAPSIYDRWEVKEAVALALFGGVPKINLDGTRIRGDTHVLFIGDPGLAKSQILQFVAKVAPRAVYTTGKGSTAAGLTAAVVKDKETQEYMLEAGALVLADEGVAVIDEIDKMREEDRVAIHEAMEQQTVSIAKAGIVAKLNARATIIAAGNPKLGRYIPEKGLAENINLPPTILSRFDLIFILIDAPGKDDENMAMHILNVHGGSLKVTRIIDPDLLKKYIAYARRHVAPKLTEEAKKLLLDFFVEMRKKSVGSPVLITPRQLEALVRISEAYARMRLSDKVEVQDAERAINIVRLFLESVSIDVASGKVDVDIVLTGKSKTDREKMERVLEIIDMLEKEGGCAKDKDIILEAEKNGIDRYTVMKMLGQLRKAGLIVEKDQNCYKKI